MKIALKNAFWSVVTAFYCFGAFVKGSKTVIKLNSPYATLYQFSTFLFICIFFSEIGFSAFLI